MRALIWMIGGGAALLLALGGCAGPGETTPGACLGAPGAYISALRNAPAQVRLSGDVRISDCLAENQRAGDLAEVGGALVTAATRLNAAARAKPGGAANLRLGYLLGAAQRGSDSTGGIHAELLRRLAAAARYSPDNRPLPPRFMRTYSRGFAAGHSSG